MVLDRGLFMMFSFSAGQDKTRRKLIIASSLQWTSWQSMRRPIGLSQAPMPLQVRRFALGCWYSGFGFTAKNRTTSSAGFRSHSLVIDPFLRIPSSALTCLLSLTLLLHFLIPCPPLTLRVILCCRCSSSSYAHITCQDRKAFKLTKVPHLQY